ncbi:hypothetical protein NW762_014495 [Fusarium torreyae]|uniref:Uncharacterized protein n=1 Tax=Fusarium torreyae TaxID=1237075 RepID=A0A9W8RIN1_9HYPO|nr:hypothetical protein NW762_014495 [Fusarium torreyae]
MCPSLNSEDSLRQPGFNLRKRSQSNTSAGYNIIAKISKASSAIPHTPTHLRSSSPYSTPRGSTFVQFLQRKGESAHEDTTPGSPFYFASSPPLPGVIESFREEAEAQVKAHSENKKASHTRPPIKKPARNTGKESGNGSVAVVSRNAVGEASDLDDGQSAANDEAENATGRDAADGAAEN